VFSLGPTRGELVEGNGGLAKKETIIT
jgi:hypothetical protein